MSRSRLLAALILLCAIVATGLLLASRESPSSAQRVGVLLRAGTGSDWDTSIREIGNVVHHNGRYYFYYSGHRGKNKKGKTDIYVGVAVSDDGRRFTKAGKALELPSEDPYVIVQDGKFLMYYEDKTEVPDRHTSLAVSSDGLKFERVRFGVLAPSAEKSWQSISASSPAALVVGGDVNIIYEGYGYIEGDRLNQGQIGLFRNGRQWDQPVFTGSGDGSKYDEFVASDDVVEVGGRYFMSYHTLQSGVRWTAAVASSPDLIRWERPEAPQFDLPYGDMSVMFFRRADEDCFRYLLTDGGRVLIYANPSLNAIGLPSCVD